MTLVLLLVPLAGAVFAARALLRLLDSLPRCNADFVWGAP